MQERPILTIALMLYRSGHEASRSLLSAVLQAASNQRSIELIILDNNPGSNRTLAKSLTGENIRYIANEVNLGSSGNSLKAWNEAKGEFVQMLCDDDYLDPFFAERVKVEETLENSIYFDVIASAPTEFEKAGEIRRLSRTAEDCAMQASGQYAERASACMNWRYSNYLLWSMLRRDKVHLEVAYYFMAYCPGYTTFLDWPMTDGISICHRIKQLDYGYYIYDRKNWSTENQAEWVSRELTSYREWIRTDLGNQVSNEQVAILKSINMAAVAASYFVFLGRYYKAREAGFDSQNYRQAACRLLRERYLHRLVINGTPLSEKCSADEESLTALIEMLCENISNYLTCGEELWDFLSPRRHKQKSLEWHAMLEALKGRYSNWHHV